MCGKVSRVSETPRPLDLLLELGGRTPQCLLGSAYKALNRGSLLTMPGVSELLPCDLALLPVKRYLGYHG